MLLPRERRERKDTHTGSLFRVSKGSLSLSLSLSFFPSFLFFFSFFFFFFFLFLFPIFFLGGKNVPSRISLLSLSLTYMYIYITHFWLDLGGEKGEALLLAKTE